MTIVATLTTIQKLAVQNGLSTPYLVGGVVRDRLLHQNQNVADLDITTGDSGSLLLPHLLANSIPTASIKMMKDNHSQVIIEGIKYDFSSNFRSPHLKSILNAAGLTQPSPIQEEAYSRDFTCCALLMDLSFKKVLDPTGMGLEDIKNRRLRCCLPAAMTLSDNVKRIPRIFYLAAKLNFTVDDEIISFLKNNPDVVSKVTKDDWSKKISKALAYNESLTIKLLNDCQIWHQLPYIQQLSHIQIRNP